ncbi:hypothetical protein MUK42_35638 [Musa troglodytarum]|nr:hypothetical protein MUK42_35638 [Musa troglodytarum]
MDDISILVDLVVEGSRRARENITVTLMNLIRAMETRRWEMLRRYTRRR